MNYYLLGLLALIAVYLAVRHRKEFLEFLYTIFLVLIIIIPFRVFLYNQYYVPSGSMVPTLFEGDHVGVNMHAYGLGRYAIPFDLPLWNGRFFAEDPRHGDIAVFQHPRDEEIDLIKRVIGLPGDTIQVINGRLMINMEPVPLRRLEGIDLANNSLIWFGRLTFFEEIFEGEKHYIADDRTTLLDNTPTFTVPENHFFAMGDNRDNSNDSRSSAVGFIPMDNLIGRADIVLFSRQDGYDWYKPWHWPSLFRGERFFKLLE